MESVKESKEANSENIKAEIIEEKKENLEEKEEKNNNQYKIKKTHKWIVIAIIVAIVVIILSTGFALVNINNENIIAGVTIDKINLQGLNKQEAETIIKNKIEEKLNEEIKIKIDNEEYSMLLSQIELEYGVNDAIEKAYNVGRKSNILGNNFEILKSKIFGTDINLNSNYNEDLLNNVVQEMKEKIPNAVKQVAYCIEDDKLVITRGSAGASIDDNQLKNVIKKNINLSCLEEINMKSFQIEPDDIDIEKIYAEVHTEAQDAYYTTNPFQVFAEVQGIDFDLVAAKEILKEYKDEYEIPLIITNPKKTISQIGTEAFPDLLGTFSTRYDESNKSRTTNLKLAVSKINGKVIMPGEIFSYNKTLGKRTAEAGYKDAAGYAGGKVVQMIGGGICQISSTLYDAVVYANLDIVERHNHAFTTSYVGAGKDATVVYGSLDFKFKNNRQYPITIKATAQNGIAKVSIYGIREETEYEVEIATTILNYIPFKVIYEDDASLDEGTEKVTQYGSNGCKSITYKILKLNGKEVSRSVLSTDTYDPMNKYITRGTKKTTPVVAPPEPTVPETPEEPETPAEPETPEEPETPVTPVTPAEPVIPETPEEPEQEETAA
ncbi:MAG: VanW family protein [Clostridia bacterium]